MKYLFVIIIIIALFAVTGASYYYSAPSDFSSVDELKTFLAKDDSDTHTIFIADENGYIYFNNSCEDGAFQLRNNAFAEGKRIETEILTKQECIKYYKKLGLSYADVYYMNIQDSHMICKAIIGNEIWYIEPSTDKIVLAYNLD